MKIFSCPRTHELAAALKAGHMESAWDPSLRDHAQVCRECSDYALLNRALRTARAESMQSAPLSRPGLLWWRAQIRRRNQALQQISRPTSIIGKLALVSTFIVALIALFWQRQEGAEWLRWLFGMPDAAHRAVMSAPVSIWNLLLGVISLGALDLLGAFALFLASEKS